MSKRLGALGLVILSVFVGAACAAPAPAPTPTRAPATPTPSVVRPSAVTGKAIYDTNCAPCHGSAGKGDGPAGAALSPKPANFTDLAFMRRATPARFFDIITNGKAGTAMSPFGASLGEGDRWNVLFYEWSFSTSPERVAAGKKVYEANCVACHGASGKGDGPAGVALSPKPANFTELENMKNKSNQELFNVVTNGKLPMPSFQHLSEDDRWNVLDHIRTFSATLFP